MPDSNPLKVLRESLELTREELATASGVAYQRILDTESGRRGRIPIPILHFLREFCRVDTRSLERDFATWFAARSESIRQEMLDRTSPPDPAGPGEIR